MKTEIRRTDVRLPVLYKRTGDKLRCWETWSSGDIVFVKFGDLGGKQQTTSNTEKGKNLGRANETSGRQQAAIRAKQLWDAKIKEGFLADEQDALMTTNALGGPQVMLAHVWEDLAEEATFPAYAQPKLDGLRCAAQVVRGKCTLYSRSQKIIDTVPHINRAVESLAKRCGVASITLDGELYNHFLRDDFGKILGIVKRGCVGEESEIILYNVYDIVDVRENFSARTTRLAQLMKDEHSTYLNFVETVPVKDRAELTASVGRFVRDGYEGGMYRSLDGPYEPKRSRHLLKIKQFRDDEFKVIGCEEGKGKLSGLVGSWICVTDSGREFKAKQEGALKDVPKFHSPAARAAVGQWLTVRYQNLTKDGSPRFPVAVRFRRAE
jgi:DNA ligase-1